jgi:uncharacterized protein YbaR (Trm112 family)
MIEPELLEILACPWCVTRSAQKGKLEPQGPPEKPSGLKCKTCGRFYKIDEQGIPNLLLEDAIEA